MRLLVDTNRYAAVIGHDASLYSGWQDADEVWLSIITVGELLAGFALGSRRQENEQRLAHLLDVQGVGVLIPDRNTAEQYAAIHAALRRGGTPIPTNDVWIAALALQHGLTLDTADAHFQQISGRKFA